jgi:hypothetical protein
MRLEMEQRKESAIQRREYNIESKSNLLYKVRPHPRSGHSLTVSYPVKIRFRFNVVLPSLDGTFFPLLHFKSHVPSASWIVYLGPISVTWVPSASGIVYLGPISIT